MCYTINSKSSFVFRFFLVVLLTALFFTTPITADTLNVPSASYPTIQDAIDAAGSGDIVQVAAGIYYERITHKSGVHVLGAGKTVTTINGQSLGAVVTATNVSSTAKLDGFTITNGSGFSSLGGGIHLNNGDLVISNCRITDNHTSGALAKGGGIYCTSGSSATIQDCEITLNSSKHGGGIYIDNCAPAISNCQITQNTATGDDKGGGIFCTGSSTSSSIIDCTVSNNDGSGIYCGIYSHPTIENCTITDNDATDAAGVYCWSSSPTLVNTVIADNTSNASVGIGGAMLCYFRSPTLVNCVLYNNSAYRGSAIYFWQCSPVVYNSILWANTSALGPIYTPDASPISVTYCDVEGGYTGTGNISTNPDFVNAPGGNFHLQITSDCINKGTDIGAPEYDFEGDPRLASVGGDNVPDMGVDETTYFPNPPSDLQAHQTSDRIHLTWQDNSDDETGFRIESKVSVFGTWQSLATVEPDTTFYQASYALNFEYFYRVAAFNANGDSMYSNEVSIYTLGSLTWLRLDVPNGGEDWPEQSTQTINWSNGMFPPDYVNLYYSTDTQCTWQLIEADVPNTGSYSWTVPPEPSDTCLVKVESATSSAMYDLSNEYFTISVSPNRFEIIEDTSTSSKWFGGDNRPGLTRNVGAGQSITLARSAHVSSAGFRFKSRFDYSQNPDGFGHEVTLVLNVCSDSGTIVYDTEKVVPAEFDGGWVIFDLDTDLWAGQEYIFTCYLQNGEVLKYSSGILARNDDPWPESTGYSANVNTSPFDMEDWSNWSVHSWDFNFRIAGVYTDRSRADFNADGIVELRDLATLANNWLRINCQMPDWCENTDLDWNTTVEFADFAVFADDWLFIGYKDIDAADIAAMEDQMNTAAIDGSDGNDFWPGTYFIYKTNLGRYGKFIVANLDKSQNNQLTIAWVTYEAGGSVYSSGSGLIIRGTWSCDLDEGQEGPAAGDRDWSWAQISSTTRRLYPQNGAKFKLMYRAD